MTSPLRQADGSDRSAEEIAYPVLYRHLLPRTLRWLRQFGVAERHREDVAQEVWIRVLRTLEHYESDRPFEPWLMTITFRAACDHLKRADVRHERLSEAGEVEPQATPATEDLVVVVSGRRRSSRLRSARRAFDARSGVHAVRSGQLRGRPREAR